MFLLALALVWVPLASAQIRTVLPSGPVLPGVVVPLSAAPGIQAPSLSGLEAPSLAPLDGLSPLPSLAVELPSRAPAVRKSKALPSLSSLEDLSTELASPNPTASPEAALSLSFDRSRRSGETVLSAAPERPLRRPLQPEKPSVGRVVKLGLAAAVAMAAVQGLPNFAEQVLGWVSHPNYDPGAPAAGPLLLWPLLRDLGRQTLLGPLIEETVFRWGVMRLVREAVAARLPKLNPFWISALTSSTLFALLHESSDPFYFAARLAASMGLAWAYEKGGLRTSVFAHGLYNLLMAAPVVAGLVWGGVVQAYVLRTMAVGLPLLWAAAAHDLHGLSFRRLAVLAALAGAGLSLSALEPSIAVVWGVSALLLAGYAWFSRRFPSLKKKR